MVEHPVRLTVPFLRPRPPALADTARYYRLAEEARFYSNGGPCERLLRQRLTEYVGGAHCIPVNNATSGLIVAILAGVHRAGTRRRRHVVLPSYTFAATAGAVEALGYQPVFVDVDRESWQVEPGALDTALDRWSPDVAAVVVTHTFGTPPGREVQDRWRDTCVAHAVPMVVDAAAGFGAVDGAGRVSGSAPDTHVFSFHATKPFAVGESGVVTTHDAELAELVDGVRQFGFAHGREVSLPGINAKMDELHAATALAALDGYGPVLAARRSIAADYRTSLEPSGFTFQTGAAGATWQAGYLQAPDPATRDAVLAAGLRRGVGITAYYDRPLHRHAHHSGSPTCGDLPVTDSLAARALALPMADDLSIDERRTVVDVVLGATGGRAGRVRTSTGRTS